MKIKLPDNKFKRFLFADRNKKGELYYLILVFAIYGFGCFMSQILYPGGYSIFEYYISDQGYIAENPQGCWFYIICTTELFCGKFEIDTF